MVCPANGFRGWRAVVPVGPGNRQASFQLDEPPGFSVPLRLAAIPGDLAGTPADWGRYWLRQFGARPDKHVPLGSQSPYPQVVLVLGGPGD